MRAPHAKQILWAIALLVTSFGLATMIACSSGSDRNTQARGDNAQKLEKRTVTGTIKEVVSDGIVVVGREADGTEKEWAFTIEPDTRGVSRGLSSFHPGDPVTVVFKERDGKIMARSITSGTPSEIPASGNR